MVGLLFLDPWYIIPLLTFLCGLGFVLHFGPSVAFQKSFHG